MLQPSPSSLTSPSSLNLIPSLKSSQNQHHYPIRAFPPQHQLHSTSAPSQSLNFTAGDDITKTTMSGEDGALLYLLRQRKTDEAYKLYSRSAHLPGSTCLSRLVAQLSYQGSQASLARAQSVVRRLREEKQLDRLDANSLGLLAVAAARSGALAYALSVLRSVFRSGYLPHVKAWSAVAARLASAPDDGPENALRLFDSVLRRIRRVSAAALAADARPDTAAFNAALNACANLGDAARFAEIFDETMKEFDVKPDVLSYNVLIKMCARVGRKDLLVFVLERIIKAGIVPCITTLHSLVAAYVGFGDLTTAEKLVQAMRDGRSDLCAVLRETSCNYSISNSSNASDETNSWLEKTVEYSGQLFAEPPQLLPKIYKPDSRIYTTLMKGYMKSGRHHDVVRMVRAMQKETDPASRPDEVTYTTVISALVAAGNMDRARAVLDEMALAGAPANRITYNVLLKGFCQQLELDKARELVRYMSEHTGIEPNVVSYNILIDGCILVDDSAGALAYFNQMRECGIAPSKVSYTTLMKAFALSGQPRLAHKVFDEMSKDPRVKVDRVAWNMLVDGYCRLGLVEEAKKIISKMKESGLEPDVATYGSLANGITLARKPGEALLLWNEVKERCNLSPPLRPDEGLLDALADICVRAAFFKKALEIVACMEENGISPNKTKYKRIYVEMHSKMFTSKHASKARQDRRAERKRAAEAFKFWLGLPNSYYGSEWRLEPIVGDEYEVS